MRSLTNVQEIFGYMKKSRYLVLILALVFVASCIFTGCSSFMPGNGSENPADIIKEHYGDKQFKISFSVEGLDDPLSDVYYSANSIPKLPTPERVGYVFAGWYFDAAYTKPYQDEYLYLYMTDVTLYAKWEKESLTNNGIYDIEFDAYITNVRYKGELADEYGYKDFSDAIIEDETYIEKTDDGTYLKLSYDSGVKISYGMTPVYSVSIDVASMGGSKVEIDEIKSVTAEVDTQKTLYIDISNIELSDSIYLTVSYLNYEAGLSSADRTKTNVIYTVEFKITRFIGFGSSFVDTSGTLDDGYYLAQTHYINIKGYESVMDSFNPVYSYIYAENGHYTLIKPMMSYLYDAAGTTGEFTQESYFARLTTFSRYLTYYLTEPSDDVLESDVAYWPEYFDAESYGVLTYEFHADTGRYYYLIDLGTDINKDIVLQGVSSGPMEAWFHSGASALKLSISLDQITKLSETDYEPLEGDAYKYSQEVQYYPGNTSDLDENTVYESFAEYGFSTPYINFFFSATGDIGLNTEAGQVYSSKITISPTAQTSATAPADSRYNIAYFNMTSEVYGYDAKSMSLGVDTVQARTYGIAASDNESAGYSQRDRYAVRNGKSLTDNMRYSLQDIYEELVDLSSDWSKVSYTAYEMSGNSVNWNKAIDLSEVFTFGKDIQDTAVLFSYEAEDGLKSTLIELRSYQSPAIEIEDTVGWEKTGDNLYTTDKVFEIGDMVKYPAVSYSWYDKSGKFIDLYGSNIGQSGESIDVTEEINSMKVILCDIENGIYSVSYPYKDSEGTYDLVFSITSEYMQVIFEVENAYGERELVAFEYRGAAKGEWSITSGRDEITSGEINYDSDGNRINVNKKEEYTQILQTEKELNEVLSKTYSFEINDTVSQMQISSYTVKTNKGITAVSSANAGTFVGDIHNLLSASNGVEYAYLEFTYASGDDIYTVSYTYKMLINGKETITALDYDKLFTNHDYSFQNLNFMNGDGNILASVSSPSTAVYYFNGDMLANAIRGAGNDRAYRIDNGSYGMTYGFYQPGQYRFVFTVTFGYDENGDFVFGERDKEGTTIKFYKDVEVMDEYSDVTVTYVTDKEHPFVGNIPDETLYDDGGEIIGYSYSVTFNLLDTTATLDSTFFDHDTNDRLYGWTNKSNPAIYNNLYRAGDSVSNFIGNFNSDSVTLYAIWDEGVTVVAQTENGEKIGETIYYYDGSYTLRTYDFYVTVPDGYKHVGWKGDMFDDGLTDQTSVYATIDAESGDTVYITAIFKQLLTVQYLTDNPATEEVESSMVIGNSSGNDVIDGAILSEVISSSRLRQLKNVRANDGFVFDHWAVQLADGQLVEFDVDTGVLKEEYAVNGVVTLVAVYTTITAAEA